MDQNTVANIESNLNHAISECEGLLKDVKKDPVDPDALWKGWRAASGRIGYVATLLEQAGHPQPSVG